MSSASRKQEWETFRPELDTLYLKLDLETKEIVMVMERLYTFQASKEEYGRHFQNWGFRKKLTQDEWTALYYYVETRRKNNRWLSFYHKGRLVSRNKVAKGLSRYRPSSLQQVQQKVAKGKAHETLKTCHSGFPTYGLRITWALIVTGSSDVFVGPYPALPVGFSESRLESANKELGLDVLPWIQFLDGFLEYIKGSVVYDTARANTFGPHSLSQDLNRSLTSFGSIEIINGLFSDLEFAPRPRARVECLVKQQRRRSANPKPFDTKAIASSLLTRTKPIFLGRTDEDLLKMLRRLFCASGENFCQTLIFFAIFLSANNFLRDEKLQDAIRWLRPHVELARWRRLISNQSEYMKSFLFRVLHAAIGIGFIDLVKALLEEGLGPNPPTSKSSEHTFLQVAVASRNAEIARLLLSFGVEVNHLCSQQRTILELAVGTGDPELVRVLLEAGALVNGPQNRDRCRTALLEALIDGHVEIAIDLVEHGANVDAVDQDISSASYGWSCLTAAVFTRSVAVAQLILTNGAAVNYQHVRQWRGIEVRGITALHAACKVGCSKMVSLLLNSGADPHLLAADLGTPIRVAAFAPGDRSEIIQTLCNASTVFQFINGSARLSRGSNQFSTSQDTRSPNFHRLVISTLTDCDLALRDAAIRGNIKSFRLLLNSGANSAALDIPRVEGSVLVSMAIDVNGYAVAGKCDIDRTPAIALQAAILANNETMTRALLDAGADINVRDINGQTALHAAVSMQNHRLVRLLLDEGTDVDHKDLQSPLAVAALRGDIISVRMLLERGSSVSLPVDKIPVMAAASSGGNLEVVRLLLENGAPIDTPGNRRRTALEVAVNKGNFELVRLLLAAGAYVDVPWPREDPSSSERPSPPSTALQKAIVLGDMRIVQILLEYKADVNAVTGPRRASVLQIAVLRNDLQIFSALLHAGARINSSPEQNCGQTALQLAAQVNNAEIVKELLRLGADVNLVGYRSEQPTALQSAVENRNIDMARALLDAGAAVNAPPRWSNKISCTEKCCSRRGRHPKSALQSAVGGGMELLTILIDAGADVNAPALEDHGETALQCASCDGSVEEVELLLTHGADVNAAPAGIGGRTALQMATMSGRTNIALLLIHAGADISAKPARENGITALEGAAAQGRLNVVELLVCTAKRQGFLSSLDFEHAVTEARNGGHVHIVEYLRGVENSL